jgi:outer membrane protein OmpA-like peptidoglycan-associated protein
MQMFMMRVLFAAAIVMLGGVSAGYVADARACRDADDIGRFQGSSLVMCANKDFAEYVLPTGPMQNFDFDTHRATFAQQLSLEGRLSQNVYAVPLGSSSAQVFRNFRELLLGRNYSFLYEGKQADLGDHFGSYFEWVGPGTQLLGYSPDEARYLAATKDENGVKTYVALYVIEYDDGYDRNFEAAKGQVLVRLDVLKAGALGSQMIVVSAGEIERRIQADNKIVLYDIHFDFNSAVIKPESRPAVEQIAAYLDSHPIRGLGIVGHTDSIGGPEFNLQLSRARSEAVVSELVNRFGISPSRLNAIGAGMQQPIAPNDTEEGRAMNRRVELVPR